MLGGGAIAGSTNTGAKRVAGGASRSTLLTGGLAPSGPGTTPPGGYKNPMFDY